MSILFIIESQNIHPFVLSTKNVTIYVVHLVVWFYNDQFLCSYFFVFNLNCNTTLYKIRLNYSSLHDQHLISQQKFQHWLHPRIVQIDEFRYCSLSLPTFTDVITAVSVLFNVVLVLVSETLLVKMPIVQIYYTYVIVADQSRTVNFFNHNWKKYIPFQWLI